jgi:dTDP-4-amino-4,6-dideoxygalactose transaminase
MGEIGTTSFFPSKNLGCFGDGGALFTNDDKLAEKLWMISNHGSKQKYYHDIIGINSRLDTLQAAILNVKLKKLDHYIQARKEAAAYYDSRLNGHKDIIIPQKSGWSDHTYHQYTIRVLNGKRDWLKLELADAGIPSMVYYPVPLSLQKAFLNEGYRKGDFPVTEMLCNEVLSLPMHTELSHDQLEYITETLLANI